MALPAVALTVALEKTAEKLDNLVGVLTESFKYGDRAQKYSLGLGMTLKETSTKLKPSLDGLRGAFEEKFAVGVDLLTAGLQGNFAGMAKLVNQQKLTGSFSQETTKVQAALTSVLNLGNVRTNDLSLNLIKFGNTYGVKTDKLIDTLASIDDTFGIQNLAGFGDKFVGAISELQARLGPQLQKDLTLVARELLDPSLEAYERLSVLGLQDVRERIANSRTQAEATQIFEEAIRQGAGKLQSFLGDASKQFFRIGLAQDIYTRNIVSYNTLAINLNKRTKDATYDLEQYAMTMKTLKREVMAPLVELLATRGYPEFLKLVEVVTDVGKVLTTSLADKLTEVLDDQELWKKVSVGIVETSIYLIDSLEKLYKFINKITPKETHFWENLSIIKDLLDGKSFKDIGYRINLEKFQKEHGVTPDSTGKRLFGDLLKQLEDGSYFQKETAENTKKIEEKLPDTASTSSNYLQETARLLSESVASVIGIRRDESLTYLSEMTTSMRTLVDINAQQAAKGESMTPAFIGR